MKINKEERQIAINAFYEKDEEKRIVFIDCNCCVTEEEGRYTVDWVLAKGYTDEYEYITSIELSCDAIEDACDAASEQYCD